MRDQEKFTGFKQKLIADNEAKYGKEIREKYGEEQVQQANRAVRNMTQEQHAEIEKLAAAILRTLQEALQTGDPAGELAQQAAHMHRQWISFYWGAYDKDAHAGLAQMYVEDERFRAYYDREQPGTAVFLRDAVQIYTRGL